jgi:hypothetical protein
MAKKTTVKRKVKGRTPPMVPKAGITLNKRRYDCGGKVKKG